MAFSELSNPLNGKLKVLSFGAGAIGTYIGGSLALAGHQVVFVEHPAVVEELHERGLRLDLTLDKRRKTNEAFRITPPTFLIVSSLDDALRYGPFDVALFALKSFDTQAALEGMKPYADKMPPVLCLSNGVSNEPAIAEALGSDRVIYGTVTSAIGRRGAGDIVLEKLRGVGVAKGQPLSEKLNSALDKALLNSKLFDDAASMKWSKMLTNLLANATSAILDMTPAQIFAHPGVYQLEVQQLREALRVMAAQNIDAVDLPGTPVRALAFAVRGLPPGVSRPLLRNAVGSGRGGKMPSFHIDLNSGRGQTEVDALNGAVVRFGERLGVATPVNRLLSRTLQELARGEIPRDAFSHNPEKLLKGLKER
jgi:2-dehydropantoate 2-reductase